MLVKNRDYYEGERYSTVISEGGAGGFRRKTIAGEVQCSTTSRVLLLCDPERSTTM
jgi:hypothetical protein